MQIEEFMVPAAPRRSMAWLSPRLALTRWRPDMKIIRSKDFTAARAWGAMTVANMQGITTRLHWTDKPYKWHINEGEEVFAVLDGRVEMRYRDNCGQCSVMLETGDIFFASAGTEHLASPVGEARVLVVEVEGSD
jgi:mannose-6-phosphate isomerase-like protein (cupin superfamily)